MNWFFEMDWQFQLFVTFLAACILGPVAIGIGKLCHVPFFMALSWWWVAGPLILCAVLVGLFAWMLSQCDFG